MGIRACRTQSLIIERKALYIFYYQPLCNNEFCVEPTDRCGHRVILWLEDEEDHSGHLRDGQEDEEQAYAGDLETTA